MVIYSNNQSITQEQLHHLYEYRDGELYYKTKTSRKLKIGDVVGTTNSFGYKVTKIDYKSYRVHRLIFMYHYGYMPKIIDHIDGNRSNNRIENLREVSQGQNQYNRKIKTSSTSGIKGVYWHKTKQKWVASCAYEGKDNYLGAYLNKDDAIKVVREFREKHHGEFANHG